MKLDEFQIRQRALRRIGWLPDFTNDGLEVEIIRRENQIEYEERVTALKQKHGFPKGD